MSKRMATYRGEIPPIGEVSAAATFTARSESGPFRPFRPTAAPRPQVKIVSDGNYFNTHVFVDGVELRCVKAATWRIGPEPGIATAILEVHDVALEVGGELADLQVISRVRRTRGARVRHWLRRKRAEADHRRLERRWRRTRPKR